MKEEDKNKVCLINCLKTNDNDNKWNIKDKSVNWLEIVRVGENRLI
jgi:hypothetical protein